MTQALIAIHFLSFSLGIGGTFANLVIGRQAARAEAKARPALAGAAGIVRLAATFALVLLWVTGIALIRQLHGDGAGLPPLFWAKIAFVVALTVSSVLINVSAILAARSGTPPPPRRMTVLGVLALVSGAVALILAVAAFRT